MTLARRGLLGVALSGLIGLAACSEEAPPIAPPACGDGHLDRSEACDDGNLVDRDDCRANCKLATCGDGVPNVLGAKPEACDDGNAVDTDSCTPQCKLAVCGDGVLYKALEACDDGNSDDSDGCTSACKLASCGDGVQQSGEQCDDGNASAGDACLPTCVLASCGDGVVRAGAEECDDGNSANGDACLSGCKLPVCGDGVVRDGVEACDDGNKVDNDGCSNACALPTCGDGIVQKGEQCDDGNQDDQDGCRLNCIDAHCGDGVVQLGKETCDDGNLSAADACSPACQPSKCGDGAVWVGIEACDDGNKVDGDGCTSACKLPTCGDGAVQKGEACDDGNASNQDGCTTLCQAAVCGDGWVQSGLEACDDGNDDDSDACKASCTVNVCGDGKVFAGIEACDDGNKSDGDACTTLCTLPSCGDGAVQAPESCDDGNGSQSDGCLSNCMAAACGDGVVKTSGAATESCDDGNATSNDACTAACQPNVCGDGHVWVGQEECDDGNLAPGDGCSPGCTLPQCGDGVVQAGEKCDDGNASDQDGCLSTCHTASCGDGKVQLSGGATEICDDGNDNDHDGCKSDCSAAVCGDGVVWAGKEACDDGNTKDGDGCTNQCKLPSCGDGALQAGEQCDDGNLAASDGCLPTCLKASCGDGFVQKTGGAVETCDDGNGLSTDGCKNDCTANVCGDGIQNSAVEACDDGNSVELDGCTTACQLPLCGDGLVQAGEQCDDGNAISSDACLASCAKAYCGDGAVQKGVEACDDGNHEAGDGCGPGCLLETCGNGVLDPGELCDDGNGLSTDGCLPTCVPASCGDGIVQEGEQCDDGNLVSLDACTALCQSNLCGDGLLWVGKEACDDGNGLSTDACKADCSLNICGDGAVNKAKEKCDDGNMNNTDGCLVDCTIFTTCGGYVSAVTPAAACQGAVPAELTIEGQGLIVLAGDEPKATIAGKAAAVTGMDQCAEVAFGTAKQCGTLKVAVPAGLTVGVHQVQVINPKGTDCPMKATFSVVAPPKITAVKPKFTCAGSVSLDITGENFAPGLTVLLGSQTAPSVLVDSATHLTAGLTSVVPGTYSVSVQAGSASCGDTMANAVTVVPKPVPLFADPPVVWQPMTLPIKLWGSGWGDGTAALPKPTKVGARLQTGGVLNDLVFVFNPAKPQNMTVTWPANLAPGAYEIVVADNLGCSVTLSDAVLVTKDTSVVLASIDPPFLKAGTSLTAILRPSAGTKLQVGTAIYFRNALGTVIVQAMSVGVQADGVATMLLPATLTEGAWDIVAVQPDGKVGVMVAGLAVTKDAPPSIDTIAPGSIPSSGATVKILGSGFGTNAKVALACKNSVGADVVTPVTTTAVTATQVTFTVGTATAGEACVVRVTNTDATYDEFSALGVTSPSENLSNFVTAPQSLNIARKHLGLASLRLGRNGRYLYAVGGEGPSGALSSVEVADVDAYGALSAWRTLPTSLPKTWSRGGMVSVGRGIFAVGGRAGGSTPSAFTAMAQVLDPADAPQIADVAVAVKPIGIGEGLWVYRVAARMEAGSFNPNGLSLPSEPFSLRVPKNIKLVAALSWAPVPKAQSYVVYRTATAGQAAGTEQVIGEVADSNFTDTGLPASGDNPRRIGDLTEWLKFYGINSIAREELSVVAAADPVTPNQFHVYAMGGAAANGAPLTDVSYTTVKLNAQGKVLALIGLYDTFPLSKGRAGAVAYRVDRQVTTRLVGEADTWLYMGAGRGANGASVNELSAAQVKTGGALVAAWKGGSKSFNGRWNYGGIAIANQLFAFGGDSGAATTGGVSGQLCGPGNKQCATSPGVENFNAGISLATARAAFGLCTQSGRIFAVGGQDAAGKPLASVESTLW